MLASIIVSLIIVFISFICIKYPKSKALEVAFLVLVVFLGIRYDFGNDYKTYMSLFHRLNNSYSLFDVVKNIDRLECEVGWALLCVLFKPVGFFGMVFILTFAEYYLVYRTIKDFVPPKYYWLALFFLLFNPNLMLIGASGMRQWLAVCISLYSIRFILKKKQLYFFLSILIACSFHKSALIFAPVFLVGLSRSFLQKPVVAYSVLPLIVLWFFIAPNVLPSYLDYVFGFDELEAYSGHYTRHINETREGTISFLGLISTFIIPTYAIIRSHRFDVDNYVFVFIYLLSLIFIPISNQVMMAVRLNFYFWCVGVIALPLIMECSSKTDKKIETLLVLIVVLPTLRIYFNFFNDPLWEKFLDYSTIFSQSWQ